MIYFWLCSNEIYRSRLEPYHYNLNFGTTWNSASSSSSPLEGKPIIFFLIFYWLGFSCKSERVWECDVSKRSRDPIPFTAFNLFLSTASLFPPPFSLHSFIIVLPRIDHNGNWGLWFMILIPACSFHLSLLFHPSDCSLWTVSIQSRIWYTGQLYPELPSTHPTLNFDSTFFFSPLDDNPCESPPPLRIWVLNPHRFD